MFTAENFFNANSEKNCVFSFHIIAQTTLAQNLSAFAVIIFVQQFSQKVILARRFELKVEEINCLTDSVFRGNSGFWFIIKSKHPIPSWVKSCCIKNSKPKQPFNDVMYY